MPILGPPYATNPYILELHTPFGSLYNVTSECIRMSYSRSLADPFSRLRADEGLFEFDNPIDIPYIVLSPGDVLKLQYKNVYSGDVLYNAYSGRIKRIIRNNQNGFQTTIAECLSDVERLAQTYIDTPLLVNLPVSSLFAEVMNRTTAVASYACDLILDIVDFASYDNKSVVSILDQIVRSGYYTLHGDGAGTIRLRSRYYEQMASPIATVAEMERVITTAALDSVINKITVRANPVKQATDVGTVAYLNQPISLPASGHSSFNVSFIDPRNLAPTQVGSTVALVSGTDYAAFANSDGTGTNLTATLSVALTVFGSSVVASLFNASATPAWLTKFQIRGYPLLRSTPLSVVRENTDSRSNFGLHEASFDDMLISNYEFLSDIAESIIGDRAYPRFLNTMDLVNDQPLIWRADVGDTLSIRNNLNGQFTQWLIRGMHHDIVMHRGEEHRVTYDLREPADSPWLILDNNTLGVMDGDRILAP